MVASPTTNHFSRLFLFVCLLALALRDFALRKAPKRREKYEQFETRIIVREREVLTKKKGYERA